MLWSPCRYHPHIKDPFLTGISPGQLVLSAASSKDLTNRHFTAQHTAHLDPDLNAAALARQQGWRPIFGQAAAAQSHLTNQNVGIGDLFLFYGWFRRVNLYNGQYRFVRGAPNLHVIFAWLQVGATYNAGPAARSQAPQWARYHAHFANAWSPNRVYVAGQNLHVPGVRPGLPGGGVFSNFLQRRCLTAPTSQLRSVWSLPKLLWFGQLYVSWQP